MRTIALLAALACGCTSEAVPPSNVVFLEGHESDLWTRDPVPARVEANLVADGQSTLLGQAPAPTTSFPITNRAVPFGKIARFAASAFDSSGAVVARGTSPNFLIDAIDGLTVPLFVARSGGWSRPPDALEHAHSKPVVVSALPHILIAAGGDSLPGVDGSVPDLYNLAVWKTLRSQPPFPRSPKSAAIVGSSLLVIDETAATWLDLSNDTTREATAPDGLTFAEIAGGSTVVKGDGTSFIVGATRSTGDPTMKVLRIGVDGKTQALTLTTPRLGAAAGLVGDKVVVAGGSPEGSGVEVLNETDSVFINLGAPPDATTGAGVALLDGTTMLLAGGKDPTTGASASVRTLDLTCGAACVVTDLGPMPAALARARVFRIDGAKVLVTGDADDGETRSFSVATLPGAVTIVEQPLRERRKGATAVLLPNAQAGLVGGVSIDGTDTAVTSFEAYFP